MAATPTAEQQPGMLKNTSITRLMALSHSAARRSRPSARARPRRAWRSPIEIDGHVERDARAVDHPAQDVAPEPVGAEQRLRARLGLDEVEVLLVGRLGARIAGEAAP